MATPKTPPTPSKSVREITAKLASTPKLVRDPQATNGATPPAAATVIDQVGHLRQEIAANRLAQSVSDQAAAEIELQRADTEAKLAEAELRKLESRTRLDEIRASIREGSGTSSQAALTLAMIEMMKDTLEQSRNGQGEGMQNSLLEVVKFFREQLADVRAEINARFTAPKEEENPLEKLSSEMQLLLSMKEMFESLSPRERAEVPVLSGAAADLELTIRQSQISLEHQRKMAELDMQQARWRAEMDLKTREIEAEENRAKILGQSLSQVAEVAKPLIAEFAQMATGRIQPQPAMGYAVSPPPVPAAPAPERFTVVEPPVQADENGNFTFNPSQFGDLTIPHCLHCQQSLEWPEDKSQTVIECPRCRTPNVISWDEEPAANA